MTRARLEEPTSILAYNRREVLFDLLAIIVGSFKFRGAQRAYVDSKALIVKIDTWIDSKISSDDYHDVFLLIACLRGALQRAGIADRYDADTAQCFNNADFEYDSTIKMLRDDRQKT